MSVSERKRKRIEKLYEYERVQMSELLHDEFGQSLAAIKSFSSMIKNTENISPDIIDLAKMIEETANDLYVSSYDLMKGLRSEFTQETSLSESIKECVVNSRAEYHGINVEFDMVSEERKLESIVNVFILRFFQDSLMAAIRSHSIEKMKIKLVFKNINRLNKCDVTLADLDISLILHNVSAFKYSIEKYKIIQKYANSFDAIYSIGEVIDDIVDLKLSVDITDFIKEINDD